jgi:cell division septal protein FtsQ
MLALEVVALCVLALAPQLRVSSVSVSGLRHLDSAQVLATARIARGDSLLLIDPEQAVNRILALSWVRRAEVRSTLPGTVVIDVTEWTPAAAWEQGGRDYLLSDAGRVLGQGAGSPAMPLIRSAGRELSTGEQAVDPQLLRALSSIWTGFQAGYGQTLTRFELDSTGALTLVLNGHLHVYLGRALTPEELAALPSKLAALKALSAKISLGEKDLDYINLMNPQTPAVKRIEPSPSPTPGVTPSPSAGAAAPPPGPVIVPEGAASTPAPQPAPSASP